MAVYLLHRLSWLDAWAVISWVFTQLSCSDNDIYRNLVVLNKIQFWGLFLYTRWLNLEISFWCITCNTWLEHAIDATHIWPTSTNMLHLTLVKWWPPDRILLTGLIFHSLISTDCGCEIVRSSFLVDRNLSLLAFLFASSKTELLIFSLSLVLINLMWEKFFIIESDISICILFVF